jgi:hypothetical protein
MAEYRIAASLYKLVSSEPASGTDGQVIFNESTDELKIWINGSWVLIQTGTDGGTFDYVDGGEFEFMDGTYFDYAS